MVFVKINETKGALAKLTVDGEKCKWLKSGIKGGGNQSLSYRNNMDYKEILWAIHTKILDNLEKMKNP